MIDPHGRVGPILREAAEAAILPRYRRLTAGEVEEKAPGDPVTVADREAERLIAARLPALHPGSRVVGEEACAADPRLLDGLGEGAVWLVDPLDGTANFAAGRGPFAVMVALLVAGGIRGAWILDPLGGHLREAAPGAGAFLDGRRVRVADTADPSDGPRRPAGALSTRFMPPEVRARVEAGIGGPGDGALGPVRAGLMCAGAEYPSLAEGGTDFGVFWRALPWDHAPGALYLREAGGVVERWDGDPYEPARPGEGLIAARSPATAREVRRALIG